MNGLELKIPPVPFVLALGVAMWLVSAYVPSFAFSIPWRLEIATAFWLFGFAVAVAGVVAFQRAKTTVNPLKPGSTSALVTSGVYRLSRNPMYLGFLLALTGWADFLSHMLAFVCLPFFVAYTNRFQILPEERALAAKFGHEFAAYQQSVRRWL